MNAIEQAKWIVNYLNLISTNSEISKAEVDLLKEKVTRLLETMNSMSAQQNVNPQILDEPKSEYKTNLSEDIGFVETLEDTFDDDDFDDEIDEDDEVDGIKISASDYIEDYLVEERDDDDHWDSWADDDDWENYDKPSSRDDGRDDLPF